MPKYIFVTGGVVSSLGKGLAASSIGALLEARGLRVTLIKLDPYINVDPGTMSPFQHGEVFVTDDGAETDLDLGHYERFTHSPLSQANTPAVNSSPGSCQRSPAAATCHPRSPAIRNPSMWASSWPSSPARSASEKCG